MLAVAALSTNSSGVYVYVKVDNTGTVDIGACNCGAALTSAWSAPTLFNGFLAATPGAPQNFPQGGLHLSESRGPAANHAWQRHDAGCWTARRERQRIVLRRSAARPCRAGRLCLSRRTMHRREDVDGVHARIIDSRRTMGSAVVAQRPSRSPVEPRPPAIPRRCGGRPCRSATARSAGARLR
jgi:hypothetical protein